MPLCNSEVISNYKIYSKPHWSVNDVYFSMNEVYFSFWKHNSFLFLKIVRQSFKSWVFYIWILQLLDLRMFQRNGQRYLKMNSSTWRLIFKESQIIDKDLTLIIRMLPEFKNFLTESIELNYSSFNLNI